VSNNLDNCFKKSFFFLSLGFVWEFGEKGGGFEKKKEQVKKNRWHWDRKSLRGSFFLIVQNPPILGNSNLQGVGGFRSIL